MADLDTAEKRISGINPSSPWRALLPLPDSTINQGDRETASYMYSGINTAGPVGYRAQYSLSGVGISW
jgi:hypothetical protein